MSVLIGKLEFRSVKDNLHLVADVVKEALQIGELSEHLDEIFVAEIDPNLADTAEFCEAYEIKPEESANTIVVQAKRADRKWFALCNILATTRADINKTVRKHLDAKGVSFAPMEMATELTQMEYGGIGPIGAPIDWPFLIDSRVLEQEYVVIGSGLRSSKIAISGKLMATLSNAVVLEHMAVEI